MSYNVHWDILKYADQIFEFVFDCEDGAADRRVDAIYPPLR